MSDKMVTRIVASGLLMLLVFCYFLLAKEALADISAIGPHSPKAVVFVIGLLVGTAVAIWVACKLIIDIITGGTSKPSK